MLAHLTHIYLLYTERRPVNCFIFWNHYNVEKVANNSEQEVKEGSICHLGPDPDIVPPLILSLSLNFLLFFFFFSSVIIL